MGTPVNQFTYILTEHSNTTDPFLHHAWFAHVDSVVANGTAWDWSINDETLEAIRTYGQVYATIWRTDNSFSDVLLDPVATSALSAVPRSATPDALDAKAILRLGIPNRILQATDNRPIFVLSPTTVLLQTTVTATDIASYISDYQIFLSNIDTAADRNLVSRMSTVQAIAAGEVPDLAATSEQPGTWSIDADATTTVASATIPIDTWLTGYNYQTTLAFESVSLVAVPMVVAAPPGGLLVLRHVLFGGSNIGVNPAPDTERIYFVGNKTVYAWGDTASPIVNITNTIDPTITGVPVLALGSSQAMYWDTAGLQVTASVLDAGTRTQQALPSGTQMVLCVFLAASTTIGNRATIADSQVQGAGAVAVADTLSFRPFVQTGAVLPVGVQNIQITLAASLPTSVVGMPVDRLEVWDSKMTLPARATLMRTPVRDNSNCGGSGTVSVLSLTLPRERLLQSRGVNIQSIPFVWCHLRHPYVRAHYNPNTYNGGQGWPYDPVWVRHQDTLHFHVPISSSKISGACVFINAVPVEKVHITTSGYIGDSMPEIAITLPDGGLVAYEQYGGEQLLPQGAPGDPLTSIVAVVEFTLEQCQPQTTHRKRARCV